MRRNFGKLFLCLTAISLAVLPASVAADSISVSQVITVTATVAPARSIVVNDQGQMTKIYSNTDQNVTPKVYLNHVPGQPEILTPALRAQYSQIMAQQKTVIGVAIPVSPPTTSTATLKAILMKSVSSLLRPLPL